MILHFDIVTSLFSRQELLNKLEKCNYIYMSRKGVSVILNQEREGVEVV